MARRRYVTTGDDYKLSELVVDATGLVKHHELVDAITPSSIGAVPEPAVDGTPGQALLTDGAGTRYWGTAPGSGASDVTLVDNGDGTFTLSSDTSLTVPGDGTWTLTV